MLEPLEEGLLLLLLDLDKLDNEDGGGESFLYVPETLGERSVAGGESLGRRRCLEGVTGVEERREKAELDFGDLERDAERFFTDFLVNLPVGRVVSCDIEDGSELLSGSGGGSVMVGGETACADEGPLVVVVRKKGTVLVLGVDRSWGRKKG